MTSSLPLMAAVCLTAVLPGSAPAGPAPLDRPGAAHASGAQHSGILEPGILEPGILEPGIVKSGIVKFGTFASGAVDSGMIGAASDHAGDTEDSEDSGGSGGSGDSGTVASGAVRAGVVQYAAALDADEQRRVLAYWTPGRMARAVPIDPLGLIEGLGGLLSSPSRRHQVAGPVTATSGARWALAHRPPARGTVGATTGRVFLTLHGRDFVCSASSVHAANRDLVVTAAHCVKDGTGTWARNWTFVPGYDEGRRPYGAFTARRAFVTTRWSRGGDDDHDVAMVAVNTAGGRHLADVVGAQPIAFNGPRGAHTYGFGFPADPPYTGRHLMYCAGPLRDDPNRQTRGQGLRCDLTAGASGGPWLSGFDPVAGKGTITSVSSFKYSNDRHTMYGPYFDDSIRRLYAVAEKS